MDRYNLGRLDPAIQTPPTTRYRRRRRLQNTDDSSDSSIENERWRNNYASVKRILRTTNILSESEESSEGSVTSSTESFQPALSESFQSENENIQINEEQVISLQGSSPSYEDIPAIGEQIFIVGSTDSESGEQFENVQGRDLRQQLMYEQDDEYASDDEFIANQRIFEDLLNDVHNRPAILMDGEGKQMEIQSKWKSPLTEKDDRPATQEEILEFVEKFREQEAIREKSKFQDLLNDQKDFVVKHLKTNQETMMKIADLVIEKFTEALEKIKQQNKSLEMASTSKQTVHPEIIYLEKPNESEKERKNLEKSEGQADPEIEKSLREMIEAEYTESVESTQSKIKSPKTIITLKGDSRFRTNSFKKGVTGCKSIGVKTCFSCGQNGHMSGECPHPDSVHCYRCNKLGNHIAKNCRENLTFNKGPAAKRVRFSSPLRGLGSRSNINRKVKKKTLVEFIDEDFEASRLGLQSVAGNRNINSRNVLYSEDPSSNLMSLRQFVDKGLQVYLDDKKIDIIDPATKEKVISGVYMPPHWALRLNI